MNIKFAILIGVIFPIIVCGLFLQDKFLQTDENYCTENWYVTGYYLPVEDEYLGELISIEIDGTTMQFDSLFVNQVKIEGWGLTSSGIYLGWYDDEFHLNKLPLDYFGNELVIGTIAVDPAIIELNSTVSISTLPEPWNNQIFKAYDIGSAIKGNHVDVYVGEGKDGEKETKRITGYDNTICVLD